MFKYRSIVVLESSVLNVDTVQERSKILILDDSSLLDSGTNLRDFFQIDWLKSDVVLLLFFFGDQNSFWSIDSLVHLETQKVLDFDRLNFN